MAEVTAMRNNALPYPIYGAPWTVLFPLLDADGDPVAPSSPDSEISKNGDTAGDCTNEAVEIVNGSCYLILTGTELTCDAALIQVKSTGAKTTVISLYPRKLVTIHSGTAADDGSGTSDIVLDSGASAVDDFYNGMVCIATIDGNVEVRVISDYVGSTKTASVVPDWNVAVDNNDTFVIKLPEGHQLHQANVSHAANVAWASGAIVNGTFANDAITASKLHSDVTAELQNGLATAAALATVDGIVDDILLDTAEIGAAGAGLTAINLPDQTMNITGNITGNLSGSVGSVTGLTAADVGAIKAKTDNLPSDPADASVVAGLIAAVESKVDTIDTNVDSVLADTGTDGVVVAAGSKTGYRLSSTGVDDILDEVVEGSYTMRQFLRLYAAALLGKASGLETTNAKYRDTGDSKDRIDATVDPDGNRTAVTLDAS